MPNPVKTVSFLSNKWCKNIKTIQEKDEFISALHRPRKRAFFHSNRHKGTISKLLQDTGLQKNRNEAKKAMWQFQGESGKRIVDFMMETVSKGAN